MRILFLILPEVLQRQEKVTLLRMGMSPQYGDCHFIMVKNTVDTSSAL